MKRTILLALIALGLAVGLGHGATSTAFAGPNCAVDGSIDSEEQEFLRLINNYRQQNGLRTLVLSDTLNKSSQWKSNHMANLDYFAHDDTPIGRTWVQRIRDCGYTYNTYLGENLAAGNSTASATFDQWRNSPGHNANMLNANYVAIGIGRAYNASSRYRWYWTTDFGGYDDGYTPNPPPSPVDTDGDGCTDSQELGSDPLRGGRRNPNNPWDFFDPNRDRAVTTQDIVNVVNLFGTVQGDGRYANNVDRTLLGPDSWDTGPPDGRVTMLDINLIVVQFGHSCAP